MFLEKIKQFAENLPDSLEELNLRMIDVTDELVEIITYIDFTDKDARQDLHKVLEILEFCYFLEKRDYPESSTEATNERSEVFNSIDLKLYSLSIQEVPLSSITETYLSTSSIVTLCLLYLIGGVLDDKCHEKLQKILEAECLNVKTCPFVVWCLLAILSDSVSAIDNTVLPYWIPRNFANLKSTDEHEKFLGMLIKVGWRCSIAGVPDFEKFWEMTHNTSKLSNLETWKSQGTDRQNSIMKKLADLLQDPEFSMDSVDKLLKLANLLTVKNGRKTFTADLANQKKSVEQIISDFDAHIMECDFSELHGSLLLDMFTTFFHLMKVVTCEQTKLKLFNTARCFSCLSSFEPTPELEKLIRKNFDEINSLLNRYNGLKWLYSIVYKTYPSLLSLDHHNRFNKDLLEFNSDLEGWELLAEYFKQLKWENRESFIEKYSHEAKKLFKSLVFDDETNLTFLEFAEKHKSTINQCLDRHDVITDLIYSMFASYPSFIPFVSKINNISKVLEFFDKSDQQNLMFECLEYFGSIEGFDSKYEIAMTYLTLLSAQYYGQKEISRITEIYADTINSMLLLVADNPAAKFFYDCLREAQNLLSVDVRVLYFGKQLAELNESQQMNLMCEIMSVIKNFDDSKNMHDYLVAIEMLLSELLKTNYSVKDVKIQLAEFALKHKKRFNQELMKEEGHSIFLRGSLLSELRIYPMIFDVDVKYKYLEILGDKNDSSFLSTILDEYLEDLKKCSSPLLEKKICDIIENIKKTDNQFELRFFGKYKELVDDITFIKSLSIHSPLRPILLLIPNLFCVENQHLLFKSMNISQQYDWLDKCLTEYGKKPITFEVLHKIDFVCGEIKRKEKDDERMKDTAEKHIRVIVDKIMQHNSGRFKNFSTLIMPTLP